MTSEELSASEQPQYKKYIFRRKSLDELLKNKYITKTEAELEEISNQKKDEILNLANTNQNLKQQLTKIVEEINKLLQSNPELFESTNYNQENMADLEKKYYLRKHDHSLSRKYNQTFKQQYNALVLKNKRLGSSQDLAQKILEQKDNIQILRNENIELNKQIHEIRFKNINQTKELENSKFITKLENNMQKYAQILNESSLTRFLCCDRMETKKKSVEKLKEQFKNLNEYVDKNKRKITESNKADMALQKINTEMNILKKDLDKTVDEILQNCYTEKAALFENNKNNFEHSNKNILTKSSSQQNIITYNKAKKFLTKKGLIHSQSSLNNISAININNSSPKNYYNSKTIKNNDSARNDKKNLSVFSKFKILKLNKPLTLKLGKSISEKPNLDVFVTKENIDFTKKNYEEEQELEKEIKNINEYDYQQLIDLKGKYADINDRLDIDIKNKKKICMNRINQLNNLVENNLIKLDKMKKTNEILKKELEEYELKIMEKVKKK